MLGSNIKVNQTIKSIPDSVDDKIAQVELHGNVEDLQIAIRTYRATLDKLCLRYERDHAFLEVVDVNPFLAVYTYGHFLHTLVTRYKQCMTEAEREILRLKYYPIAMNPGDATTEEWRDLIETLQAGITVDTPWVNTFLRIISFGCYKGYSVKHAQPLKISAPVVKENDSTITDTGLTGNKA